METSDRYINTYIDSLALLEVVIENKKELFLPLVQSMDNEALKEATKIAATMRLELQTVGRISVYTQSNFRNLLCKLIRKSK